jgi:hypothetical protein
MASSVWTVSTSGLEASTSRSDSSAAVTSGFSEAVDMANRGGKNSAPIQTLQETVRRWDQGRRVWSSSRSRLKNRSVGSVYVTSRGSLAVCDGCGEESWKSMGKHGVACAVWGRPRAQLHSEMVLMLCDRVPGISWCCDSHLVFVARGAQASRIPSQTRSSVERELAGSRASPASSKTYSHATPRASGSIAGRLSPKADIRGPPKDSPLPYHKSCRTTCGVPRDPLTN